VPFARNADIDLLDRPACKIDKHEPGRGRARQREIHQRGGSAPDSAQHVEFPSQSSPGSAELPTRRCPPPHSP